MGCTSASSIKLDMKRIAVVSCSADLLASYVYIPSEDSPADARFRNVATRKFGKRGGRCVIGMFPVKGQFAKPCLSNQAKGLPWWRSTEDPVNDFINNVCTDESRVRYEALFRSFGPC